MIGSAISLYIFKSIRVAVMTYVIVGLVVVWIVAFMSLSQIPLSSTTALSFGLVLVVSLAITIRIVTHFNERYQLVQDRYGSNASGPESGICPLSHMFYDHRRRVRNHDGFFYTHGLPIGACHVARGDALFCYGSSCDGGAAHLDETT